jgi:hypothetical protein
LTRWLFLAVTSSRRLIRFAGCNRHERAVRRSRALGAGGYLIRLLHSTGRQRSRKRRRRFKRRDRGVSGVVSVHLVSGLAVLSGLISRDFIRNRPSAVDRHPLVAAGRRNLTRQTFTGGRSLARLQLSRPSVLRLGRVRSRYVVRSRCDEIAAGRRLIASLLSNLSRRPAAVHDRRNQITIRRALFDSLLGNLSIWPVATHNRRHHIGTRRFNRRGLLGRSVRPSSVCHRLNIGNGRLNAIGGRRIPGDQLVTARGRVNPGNGRLNAIGGRRIPGDQLVTARGRVNPGNGRLNAIGRRRFAADRPVTVRRRTNISNGRLNVICGRRFGGNRLGIVSSQRSVVRVRSTIGRLQLGLLRTTQLRRVC